MRNSYIFIFTHLIGMGIMCVGATGDIEDQYVLESLPQIGEPIKERWEPNQLIQLSPEMSELLPAYDVYCNGLKFTLMVGIENTITSIITNDTDFVSPEGIRVGFTIQEIFDRLPESCLQPRKLFFWINGEKSFQVIKNEYEISLPSGWNCRISCHAGFPFKECRAYELYR